MRLRKYVENLLRKYSDIIINVDEFDVHCRPHVIIIKLKLTLRDLSKVYVREVRRDDAIVAYSYYWLTESYKVIEGWDNAPHHPEIHTFPHHRHKNSKVYPLKSPNLETFFREIRRKMEEE